MKTDVAKAMFLAVVIMGNTAFSIAQSTKAPPAEHREQQASLNSIENLNYLGGDVSMPPFADSPIDVNSAYRRSMFNKGLALRNLTQVQYAQNTLDGPVAADAQSYTGQRYYGAAMTEAIFTADLRQLHLNHAQLNITVPWNWVSWRPAGPKTFDIWSLSLYKEFGEDRVEVKAGYNGNNLDFVGLQVGGSTANGATGVYAVLPFEVGMAFFPLTAPTFNVKLNGPKGTYLKSAAQRSIDAAGGPEEIKRNHVGLRFDPHGDKLLLINELGYHRHASQDTNDIWFRAGYMHNSTPYANVSTGQKQPGNFCSYALIDYQLRKPDPTHANHGLYAGGSVMTVPEKLNPYARYYEARLYEEAPFRSRPGDVLSFVASHTGYSKLLTNTLAGEGKAASNGATSLTGGYTVRVSRGSYINLGLSYINGPAITPRAPNALVFTANWAMYF